MSIINIMSLRWRTFLKSNLFLILFHFVFLLVFVTNFRVGKYFWGWDALVTELNPILNIERGFFGSWQEHYGLGAIVGHAYSTILIHSLIIYIFSLLLPLWAVRQVFTFLCLYLGGLGMYKLLLHMLNKQSLSTATTLSLLGALFYMFNLGSVQIFYLQQEPFIVHFGALPWVFIFIFKILDQQSTSRRSLLLFICLNIFLSIQAFIPPLFIVFNILLFLVFLSYLYLYKSATMFIKLKNVFSILFIILLTNLYWVSPFLFYIKDFNSNFINSYNNIMTTSDFIAVNQKYGNIKDLALFKGYLFDSNQLGDLVLRPWIDHYANIFISIIGYSFYLLIILGFITFLRYKEVPVYKRASIMLVSFGCFCLLAIDTPMISQILKILYELLPVIKQLFRTPFTRFIVGYSLASTILLCFGILSLSQIIQSLVIKYFSPGSTSYSRAVFNKLFYFVLYVAFLLLIFPIFKGNLFFSKMFITVPDQYFEIMSYFNQQPYGRIADLPLGCSDAWYATRWGYFGSGLLFYGIKQPILSTYGVWGKNMENYYWEMTRAIEKRDFELALKVLEKYDVQWLLFDINLIHCSNTAGFSNNYDFLDFLLTDDSDYNLVKKYDGNEIKKLNNIYIFEHKKYVTETFISNVYYDGTIPRVFRDYNYFDYDQAYLNYPMYQAVKDTASFDLLYPFAPLFSKRGQPAEINVEYSVTSFNTSISKEIPNNTKSLTMLIPSIKKTNNSVPIVLRLVPVGNSNSYDIILKFVLPDIFINSKQVSFFNNDFNIGTVILPSSDISFYINQMKVIKIWDNTYVGRFDMNLSNSIVGYPSDPINKSFFRWNSDTDASVNEFLNQDYQVPMVNSIFSNPSKTRLKVTMPLYKDVSQFIFSRLITILPSPCDSTADKGTVAKIDSVYEYSNEYLRLINTNSSQCYKIKFPFVSNGLSYILQVNSRHIAGRPLLLEVLDIFEFSNIMRSFVPISSDFADSLYIISTLDNSLDGVLLNFVNTAKAKQSINDIKKVTLYEFPYNLLMAIELKNTSYVPLGGLIMTPRDALRINPTNYFLNKDVRFSKLLLLSQQYSDGWQAYSIPETNLFARWLPFLFGSEIRDHIEINGWKNAWDISDVHNPISIIFLPQYIQFICYLIEIGCLTYLLYAKNK